MENRAETIFQSQAKKNKTGKEEWDKTYQLENIHKRSFNSE